MTPPAYRTELLRPVDYSRRFVVNFEPRHGRPECAFECAEFSVRRSISRCEHENAAQLLERMYSRRGYATAGVINLPRRDDSITLEVLSGRQIAATVTVRFDAHGASLLAETLYKQEIGAYRQTGRYLCEVCKLAVEPRFSSREMLASLFQLAYVYAYVINRASDVFIEVNPRHAAFYTRMLGFREIGETRLCPRVNAPAVLLHMELDYMRRQIALHGGSGHLATDKSLYPYFSSCGAEELINRAMRCRARRQH